MPKIDVPAVPERKGSGYPAPFHLKAGDRVRQALGDAGGLSEFGVNLLRLPPGAWSSQRHWHSAEDEFRVCPVGRSHADYRRRRAGSSRGGLRGVSQKSGEWTPSDQQEHGTSGRPRNRHALNGRRLRISRSRHADRCPYRPLHAPGRHALSRTQVTSRVHSDAMSTASRFLALSFRAR